MVYLLFYSLSEYYPLFSNVHYLDICFMYLVYFVIVSSGKINSVRDSLY